MVSIIQKHVKIVAVFYKPNDYCEAGIFGRFRSSCFRGKYATYLKNIA